MFSRDRSKHPCQRPPATLHGVVFDILVGSEYRAGLAAVFPDEDRGDGLPSRSSRAAGPTSPRGVRRQSVFAFASLKLRRTHFTLTGPRGLPVPRSRPPLSTFAER